jgi:hypothetical protein
MLAFFKIALRQRLSFPDAVQRHSASKTRVKRA